MKIPPSFIPEFATTVLTGDGNAISGFVVWDETPQGALFWAKQHADLTLNDEGRAYIEAVLEACE